MTLRHILAFSLCLSVAAPALADHSGKEPKDTTISQKRKSFDEYAKERREKFKKYSEKRRKEFDEYRKQRNAEFAKFLAQRWDPMKEELPLPAPKEPDPVEPPVAPLDKTNPLPLNPVEIPRAKVEPMRPPKHEAPKEIPIPPLERPKPRQEVMSVSLFGMPLNVSMREDMKFQLPGIKESDISHVWSKLSGDEYTPMFEDCARHCAELKLNGWGTLNLCKAVGETLEGKGTNAAVVVQTYLMTQLGYDARLIRANESQLIMMCPANVELCQISFVELDGKRYYIWGTLPAGSSIISYKTNFNDAVRSISFEGRQEFKINSTKSEPRTFTSKWNKNASVSVSVNKSLMDYYEHMPLINDWSFYARQPMDESVRQQVLPTLKQVVSGKSELDAVNELLHFVQTAFKYETDQQQYNREKTDFKEEPFYYRACDCEDRSILFSELVTQLLGLDVVLLHYPNHLATAVRFKSDVAGDFLTVEGQKYVVCDPTFINASAGNCMDRYKTTQPRVFKIRR